MVENWPVTIVHKMEENDLWLRKLAGRDPIARKEMEAGPSAIVKESVARNPRCIQSNILCYYQKICLWLQISSERSRQSATMLKLHMMSS